MQKRLFHSTLVLMAVLCGTWLIQVYMREAPSFSAIEPRLPRGGDVAVIGGTTAALVAALTAAENGAQVHLFTGGQALGNDTVFLVESGLACWGVPLQEEAWQAAWQENEAAGTIQTESPGLPGAPTRDNFQLLLLNRGEGMNDPLLLESFLDCAPSLYAWLQSQGLTYDRLPDPHYNPFWLQTSRPQAGQYFRQKLLDKLERYPVFLQEEKVAGIDISREQGRVEALLLQNEDGETALFYVQSVVLADGGYSGDLGSWKDYLPQHNMIPLRSQQTGRGLQMAASLGADIVQAGFVNRRIVLGTTAGAQYQVLQRRPQEDYYLLNRSGQSLDLREAEAAEAFSFIVRAPPESIFLLAPEEEARAERHYFTRFESWERALEAGWLEETPVLPLEPPYYLSPVKAGVDYTLGGLSVTPRGEVRSRGEPLEGLFAAGEIVGGLHGEALLEGMPFSESLFLGRTAGKAAAVYARR